MTTKAFSIAEAIDYGWNGTKSNFWFLAGVVASAVLMPAIPTFMVGHLPGLGSDGIPIFAGLFGSIAGLVQYVLQIGLHMGMIKVSLALHDGKTNSFGDLFSCFPLIFNYFFAGFVYMIAVTIGMVLLVVPGIIMAIKFQFFGFYIVDQNVGPMESLSKSAALTKGIMWQLFIFALAIFFLNVLGVLCLGVGVIVTLAISILAEAYVYRKLQAQELGQPQPVGNA